MLVAIIPTLNEEEGIGPTIRDYLKVLPELKMIIVDGGSSDSTVKIARSLGAEVLTVNERGKGIAISKGLHYIREAGINPEFVIFTDGDYTYPADRLPDMIKLLEKDGSVGAVLGNRLHGLPWWRIASDVYLMGNLIIRWLYYVWTSIKLEDPLSGLRVVRWKAIEKWSPESKGFEIETEMNLYLIRRGWRIAEIPIAYRERLGRKKLKIRDAIPIINTLRKHSKHL